MNDFKFILGFVLLATVEAITAQPLSFSVTSYDQHIELNWNQLAAADRYEIWRKSPGEKIYSIILTTRKLRLQDWLERDVPITAPYTYFIRALNVPGAVLSVSDTLNASLFEMSNDQFLDMVQRYTFRYFWEHAHPVSGMARERLNSDDVVTTGGSGFGIMSIIVGVHRGYVTREEAVNRLLQIVSFLQFADKFHGVFPHWMNGDNGNVLPFSTFDNGGDLVETAFLMQGLLAARAYFNHDNESENALREVITSLWEDVEWDFYSRNNSGVLYWHWSPEYQWQMNFPIRGYNEALIVYLLAIASPTHNVPASYWHSGWAGGNYENGNSWYGHKLFVGPPLGGPLFFAHYSYMGFDPRDIKDDYANYFLQNTNHTLINRAWCVDNPLNFEGYGENSWGLTASDDPWGYAAHAPGGTTDNGTLTTAAAIPSIPYTPQHSIEALKHFYREYGKNLWGDFGFYDAFNPEENWFADSYLAIDQGPIINMIENYRSQLLWDVFMSNPEVQPALNAIGFVEDPVATNDPLEKNVSWNVYPTITDDELYVIIANSGEWKVQIMDMHGRNVTANIESCVSDENCFYISDVKSNGALIIVLRNENYIVDSRLVIVR